MGSCCDNKSSSKKKRLDLLLWGSSLLIVSGYFGHIFFPSSVEYIQTFSESTFELVNEMWWGMLLGVIFVGILDKIPRELIMSILGKGGTFPGILRATGAGILLDLCSHGILVVGMKLYERGASLGQTMAFLIASPWNSISLTLILWALVGFWWMMAFLLLSVIIALISGFIFDRLVDRGVLAKNSNKTVLPKGYKFWPEFKKLFKNADYGLTNWFSTLRAGFKGSKMILRWIIFGMVLASLVRTFVTPEMFETVFGPTIAGLGLTVLVATVLEVCSEGSTPIAADILNRAAAPGNSFAFLMTGVSTDYTEIIAIKEGTKSWKTAFFLPLITLPQILMIAVILNQV